MAGIGFELKKLLTNNRSLTGAAKGYAYASFVTIGPIIVCIVLLLILRVVLSYLNVSDYDRNILMATILYAFVFSLVFTSGFAMMTSRFVADKIYKEEYNDIFSSLVGVSSICLTVAGLAGIAFYYNSPLPLVFKVAAYMLFMELAFTFILMVYVTALKDYKKVSVSFLIGTMVSVVSGAILILYTDMQTITSLLMAMDIGFLATIVGLLYSIQKYFPYKDAKFYEFLSYFQDVPQLFFINLFYILGIYIDNILFWLYSDLSITVAETYKCAPLYDIATFLGMVTALPAAVIFVVKVETSIYEPYKEYFEAIVGGGALKDINLAKTNLDERLDSELRFILEFQLIISFLSLIIGYLVLPRIGITGLGMELFMLSVFGYYGAYMMFIVMTLLLYFDDRKGSLLAAIMFFVMNLVFTAITIRLGHEFYGLGMFAASVVPLTFSLTYLKKVVRNLQYRVFCSQPISSSSKVTRFKKIVNWLG